MIDRNSPRYLAVYGASVARQVFDRIGYGDDDPSERNIALYVKRAHHVAERSEEQQPDADEVALQAQRDRAVGAAVRAWRCPACREGIAPGEFGVVTCTRCAPNLKTLTAKLIAAESPPPSACVPSIEGARGLDLNDDEVPRG